MIQGEAFAFFRWHCFYWPALEVLPWHRRYWNILNRRYPYASATA